MIITLTDAQLARTVKITTHTSYAQIVSDAACYFQVDEAAVSIDRVAGLIRVHISSEVAPFVKSYTVVKYAPCWLGHNGYVFIDQDGAVAQPVAPSDLAPEAAPVAEAPAKSIRYDRATKDYEMTLDGEIVGYARTYQDAETTLDALVYERLTHQPQIAARVAAMPEAIAVEIEPIGESFVFTADELAAAELDAIKAAGTNYQRLRKVGDAVQALKQDMRTFINKHGGVVIESLHGDAVYVSNGATCDCKCNHHKYYCYPMLAAQMVLAMRKSREIDEAYRLVMLDVRLFA